MTSVPNRQLLLSGSDPGRKGNGERRKKSLSEMNKGDQFEDLLVWQKAMTLVTRVYQQCQTGLLSKDWGLRDQVQRAAVSVPANIAEGYERGSRKEYLHFLYIAKGSVGELRCLLQVAASLGYLDQQLAGSLIEDSTEVSRMLKGLLNSLKES